MGKQSQGGQKVYGANSRSRSLDKNFLCRFIILQLWEANLFSRISRSYQIISVHRGSQRVFAFTLSCSSTAWGAVLHRALDLTASHLGGVREGSQEGGWLPHLSNPYSSSRTVVLVLVGLCFCHVLAPALFGWLFLLYMGFEAVSTDKQNGVVIHTLNSRAAERLVHGCRS